MAEETAATAPAAPDTSAPAGPAKVDITQPVGTPAPRSAEPESGASGNEPKLADAKATEAADADATATDAASEDQFMDPNDLPDELKGHFKRMQRAFTKRSQSLAEQRQKVEAYDAFSQNPIQTLQQLAGQYGYTLNSQDAQAALEGDGDDTPETWDDVYQRAEQRIMDKLQPVLAHLQDQRQSQIESQLDEAFPDWREYEDDMTGLIKEHPSLVNDPVKLARLAIPAEVQESRAFQKWQKKMEAKSKSARVSGGSTMLRDQDESLPDRPLTFQESIAAAKRKLARQQG